MCKLLSVTFCVFSASCLFVGNSGAQDYKQIPPFVSEKNDKQREVLRDEEERYPALQRLEARLKDLQGEIDTTMRGYRQREIDRAEAESKLRALIGEQLDILESKEYQRERVLKQFFRQAVVSAGLETDSDDKQRLEAELKKEKSRIFSQDMENMMRQGSSK